MPKVLLIDDEMTLVQMVGELLRGEGHQVIPFTNPRLAIDALPALAPELVIAHLGLDRTRTAGLGILQKARGLNPPALVLMITAQDGSGSAIEALKHGAYDYLHKPFTLEELKLRVQRALSYNAAVLENASLRKQVQTPGHFQQIIGTSDKIQSVLKLVERLADSDSSVLLSGAPGTGKELFARTIHFHSRRRFAPFIRVDCRSLPEHLLELEIFGERKAQFSASSEESIGLLTEARGGSLFLREVESLPGALQGRLLRAILGQDNQRAGETAAAVDVRILASCCQAQPTNGGTGVLARELQQQLNPTVLSLPSLRERPEDIPLLISHFLGRRTQLRQAKLCEISPEALEVCGRYRWPGNVRELEAALEHACAQAKGGTIETDDLPRQLQQLGHAAESSTSPEIEAAPRSAGQPSLATRGKLSDQAHANGHSPRPLVQELVPLKKFLRDQEVAYLQHTLIQVDGSKEKAAELLGISLATIYRKLSEPSTLASETETLQPVLP